MAILAIIYIAEENVEIYYETPSERNADGSTHVSFKTNIGPVQCRL